MGQAQQVDKGLAGHREARNDERGSTKTLLQRLASRQSNEIVIAFAGPIGCGLDEVVEATKEALRGLDYQVEVVKLSEFLERLPALDETHLMNSTEAEGSGLYLQYRRLQLTACQLRTSTGDLHILAEYAVQNIFVRRQARDRMNAAPHTSVAFPKRVAYLLDQLKRPEEVELLRALYRNLFFLVGVTRPYAQRLRHLSALGMRAWEAEAVMNIDRHEESEWGQRLDKTLHLADLFVRNEPDADLPGTVDRFVRLVHGDRTESPTLDEAGMHAAHAASLRSACLSRQVGAAIANTRGEVIATGCNDVPAAHGGLYPTATSVDHRCVHLKGQQCFNDLHKRKLQTQIGEVLDVVLESSNIQLPREVRHRALEAIYSDTRVGSLMEFSRAVHAEMDAILAIARSGAEGLTGGTLFTTTFPCHSCARHIVAAGIERVVYIEPYDKSLAQELHHDAIEFELQGDARAASATDGSRIRFQHFSGVAPRLYATVFKSRGKKDVRSGQFIPIAMAAAPKVLPEYMDNYIEFEEAAMQHFRAALQNARLDGASVGSTPSQ
jgi:deoxycytidylate deaminase